MSSFFTLLDAIAILLVTIHFGIPLVYYIYLKREWLNKPWNIKRDSNYTPKTTVIIPTYNEAKLIKNKLDNIYQQNYPRNLIETIIVDSNSKDGTAELVKEWASKHKDFNLKLIIESERRGMVPALNYALQNCQINGDIIVFTDVDATWPSNALTNVINHFTDPDIGVVTASITPSTQTNDFLEGAYRSYYNLLRVAESKIHSTPIHNGALIAFRKDLLYKIGGLPSYTGNNDSTPASIIAFMGYRAVQIDNVIVKEPVRESQFHRKIRRAQHLLLSFLKTKEYTKKLGVYKHNKIFEKIWKIEYYLHVINPWILFIGIALLITSILYASLTALTLLGIGLILLLLKTYRTWILQQLYLVIAAIRNLWTTEIAWSK